MSKEDVNRVEIELEHEKEELREDFRDIKGKLEETRAELSPSKLVESRPLFFWGVSLVLGFAFGYGRGGLNKLEKLPRVAAWAPAVFAALSSVGYHKTRRRSQPGETEYSMATEIQRVGHQQETDHQNSSELMSRTVSHLSDVGKTEIELLEVTLRGLIESQTEKIVGLLFLVMACSYGLLFLLGGIVLLLHLWLAWWLAFLITGSVIVSGGIIFQLSMNAAAKAKRS